MCIRSDREHLLNEYLVSDLSQITQCQFAQGLAVINETKWTVLSNRRSYQNNIYRMSEINEFC